MGIRTSPVAAAAALLAAASAAPAATLPVPTAYPTIGAAVSAAADGDTVLVAPGTYAEHDIFLNAPIVVRGEL